jgi:F420-non-reducing hydrogenase small subunit
MSDKKIKINLEWLSVCAGCEVGIVDLHEKILDILEVAEIQRCPVLTDIKDYPPADIGIISGAVRNVHDREAAIKMRKSCDKIIALGTCAVHGGIPGAGLVYTKEEIFDSVYVHNKTTQTTNIPSVHVSQLETLVAPLDEVIPVDLYLPGCPPHAAFVLDALIALVTGRPPKASQEAICARCNREMVKSETTTQIKMNHEGAPDDKKCFLSQGYICLGSVTLDRCMAPCPNNGMMCSGCAGPTMQILTEPNRDIRTEIADHMANLTAIPREDIVRWIERNSKTYYAYAMATRMIGRKPTFLIKKWIAEVEEEQL